MVRSLLVLGILFSMFGCNKNNESQEIQVKYPSVKTVDQEDNYFGVPVKDPYRWLENDTSEETKNWVIEQNKTTFAYLEQLPNRSKIKDRITSLYSYERFTTPFKSGKYYFFYKNDGVQNQDVLYIQEGLDGTPKMLLDPNTFSKEGTTSIGGISVSKDAKYLSYSISMGGSDWNEIRTISLPDGKMIEDSVQWVKFSGISWEKDGFYYSRYDAPKEGQKLSGSNEFHKIYYHKLGTPQSADKLIYQDSKNPKRNFSAAVSENEEALFVYESQSTSGNALYFRDLKSNSPFKQITKGYDFEYNVLDYNNGKILVLTNKNAPKYKLIEIDVKNPDEKFWKDILAEKTELLEEVTLANGKLVARYLKDVMSQVKIFELDGKPLQEISLPTQGTVMGISSKKNENILFYSFTSFTYPSTIYKYDLAQNKSEIFKQPKVDFKSEDYETKQVFYPSKDGTKIPLSIVHKKGLKLDGNNPVMLYGYGGFNINITPSFSSSRIVFLENGGIYAQANIRGGGEYGEEWHLAGTKLQKQNVFDDFIGAAEYLIQEKYTSNQKIAIMGRSNGGLLVGACMTQRPDLFKVALPGVGVLDMLRFHKFTIGWAWTGDYGSSDDSTQFHALKKYSPLHNIKKASYPATLVTTADHDDRVVPSHSFKFISALQANQQGPNPVLIRIDVMAGHGAGKPIKKRIEEEADIWAFVFKHLGMK